MTVILKCNTFQETLELCGTEERPSWGNICLWDPFTVALVFSWMCWWKETYVKNLILYVCYLCTCVGATVALRNKFSASQFWDDCRKHNVTVVQYIGEIMRYVCCTPKVRTVRHSSSINGTITFKTTFWSPRQKHNDRSHNVRLAIGNGLRADVWREFVNRFGNITVREFYGASEGNFSMINYCNKIGAVGRDTFLLKVHTSTLSSASWSWSCAYIKSVSVCFDFSCRGFSRMLWSNSTQTQESRWEIPLVSA